MSNTRTWTNISEVRKANADAGGYWFSPASMRFFKTRIVSGIIKGRYFVTAETGPSGVERFSARIVNDGADIGTIGHFNSFLDIEDAKEAIKAHAKEMAS